MNIEEVREMCLAVHARVTEDVPFGKFGYDDVAFRIAGRIFAFLLVERADMVVLKCDPERALELREEYAGIIEPAFHWNKKYWNQVRYDSPRISRELLSELIHHSFAEVLKKLSKKKRGELE